jgi:hypothetical protein
MHRSLRLESSTRALLELAVRCFLLVVAGMCANTTAAAEPIDAAAIDEPPFLTEDRDHWAYRPLARPAVPRVQDEGWVQNPIDRFILAKLEAKGLAPMPPADRVTLIRRVTFDLTGLPPTPAEVEAFVNDSRADAYPLLIDRLLASPAHGERWAQHWLDLARFAETDGFEHDLVRPDAWKYRDWVIEALNQDLPFDQFARLQLAGDELEPDNSSAAIATGFCLSGPDMPDINLQEERRHVVLNELTSTVGAVFLGLQVGCAQCHDHKYDPISQADFYRLRAVFEPAVHFESKKSERFLREEGASHAASHLMVRGDFRRAGPEVVPAFPRVANLWDETIPPAAKEAATTGRRAALARWLTRSDHPLATRVIVNRIWQHHFGAGLSRSPSDFGVMGQEPTHPELLDWLATEFPRHGWSWKWMHRLMVMSATYRQASRPTSTGWTADESEQAASIWRRNVEADPQNELWGRMSRRRLEGEAIRDAMLVSADRLSDRRGGPGIMAPLPEELRNNLRKDQWTVAKDEVDHRKRSIYLFARRNLRFPLFEVFDRPDTNASCPQRVQSTTAPQSLTMLNSEFSLDLARHLAGAVLAGGEQKPAELIDACYRRTLGRAPQSEEIAAGVEFLETQAAKLKSESREVGGLALPVPAPDAMDAHRAAALTDLCLAMFNLNEFLYID